MIDIKFNPSISVVVPIYNGEHFVADFIDSFSQQTFKNYELIFIDDGSIDNSKGLIFSSMNKYPTIHFVYFYQSNQGVSAARNKGIELSNGEYICFIDIDDFVDDLFLENLYFSCINNDKKIAICLFARDKKELSAIGDTEVIDSESFFKIATFSKLRFGIVTSIIKKDIFLNNDIYFPLGYKYGEDIYTLFRCVLKEQKLILLKKKMYLYVVNQSSAMHNSVSTDRKQNIELMNNFSKEMLGTLPLAYRDFRKYYISKLYWSIFWQAARFFSSFKNFCEFLNEFGDYKVELRNLKTYPDKRVSFSTKILLFSKYLFFLSTKLFFGFSREKERV